MFRHAYCVQHLRLQPAISAEGSNAVAVHVLSAGLARLPETRPFANFLRRRSGGIRDLRQGSLVDEDWRAQDPDALRGTACAEVPLLDGATQVYSLAVG